jgi:type IX secretion system PorP/SprF family membrane protein
MNRTIFFLLISFLPAVIAGQSNHLSDLHSLDKLGFNPAFAGCREALSVSALYRNQWVGFNDAPKIYSFSAHSPLYNKRMGLGLLIEHNSLGIFKETNLMANYAYDIEVSGARLAFGLGFGATLYNIAWNDLVSSNGGDVLIMNEAESSVIPNFSVGTYYYARNYFIGLSIPYILSRELDDETGQYLVSFNPSGNNLFLTGGYEFHLNPQIKLSPSLLMKYQPDDAIQLDCNLQLAFKDRISSGLGYRSKNTLIGMLEVQLNPQLRMAYAYDFDLSPVGRYKGGSHEIGFNYIFSFERNVTGPRQF